MNNCPANNFGYGNAWKNSPFDQSRIEIGKSDQPDVSKFKVLTRRSMDAKYADIHALHDIDFDNFSGSESELAALCGSALPILEDIVSIQSGENLSYSPEIAYEEPNLETPKLQCTHAVIESAWVHSVKSEIDLYLVDDNEHCVSFYGNKDAYDIICQMRGSSSRLFYHRPFSRPVGHVGMLVVSYFDEGAWRWIEDCDALLALCWNDEHLRTDGKVSGLIMLDGISSIFRREGCVRAFNYLPLRGIYDVDRFRKLKLHMSVLGGERLLQIPKLKINSNMEQAIKSYCIAYWEGTPRRDIGPQDYFQLSGNCTVTTTSWPVKVPSTDTLDGLGIPDPKCLIPDIVNVRPDVLNFKSTVVRWSIYGTQGRLTRRVVIGDQMYEESYHDGLHSVHCSGYGILCTWNNYAECALEDLNVNSNLTIYAFRLLYGHLNDDGSHVKPITPGLSAFNMLKCSRMFVVTCHFAKVNGVFRRPTDTMSLWLLNRIDVSGFRRVVPFVGRNQSYLLNRDIDFVYKRFNESGVYAPLAEVRGEGPKLEKMSEWTRLSLLDYSSESMLSLSDVCGHQFNLL